MTIPICNILAVKKLISTGYYKMINALYYLYNNNKVAMYYVFYLQ